MHLSLVSLNADRIIRGECVSSTYLGNYPIEHRAGEIERLHIQSDAMAPDALAMLDRIRPTKKLDMSRYRVRPRGITDLLSARVGPAGRVVGLDMDAEFLEHARRNAPSNVEFHLGDAYGSDLSAGTFDLVHMRFVASTAGNPEQLLKEATRPAPAGRYCCASRARRIHAQLLSAASGVGPVEGRAPGSVTKETRPISSCKAVVQSSSSGGISECRISDRIARRSFH